MLKTILSFLLFVFITQTVLAGIEMHNQSDDDHSFDIVEHYIDKHISASQCDPYSATDPNELTNHSNIDNYHGNDSDEHQHSCHGHTTSFPFADLTLLNLDSNRIYPSFFYESTDHSAVLNTAYRPPIAS